MKAMDGKLLKMNLPRFLLQLPTGGFQVHIQGASNLKENVPAASPANVFLISPQNQDQLRLIQHWWWKFQMLNGYPYNCILNYMAYRCDVR